MRLSPPRLKAARVKAHLTQEQVAELAGVSTSTVHRAETGRLEPGANALARMAAVLGVPLDSLFVVHDEDGNDSATRGRDGAKAAATLTGVRRGGPD